jgi:hypothetical protein
MRSRHVSRAGGHLFPVMLILCLTSAVPSAAEARVRIETGRDLHTACSVLAEHALNPVPPTPAKARYCRQYLSGYFESLRHLHNDHDGKGVYAPAGDDPYACLNFSGPRSFDQLARSIVRTGDWHPELLDGEPFALAHKTFSDNPPCS